ncbi:MAG: hypothetical protein ACSLFL_03280, partial [Alphaproteobacteria bacterium]
NSVTKGRNLRTNCSGICSVVKAWMRGEILLARLQQALGLTREMLLEEHRCQHKHIGFRWSWATGVTSRATAAHWASKADSRSLAAI